MSRVREKRINKLKKAHKWPAVIFLIFSILLTIAAAFVFMGLILSYLAADRLQTTYETVSRVSSFYYEKMNSESEQQILNHIEESENNSDAVYLVDNNGKILAGFGGATFYFDKSGEVTLLSGEKFDFYFDTETINTIFTEDGDANLSAIIRRFIDGGYLFPLSGKKNIVSIISYYKNTGNFLEKKLLAEEDIWIGKAVSSNETLLVKCKISFYTLDIMLVLIMGFASVLIMMLPLIFLFINVLTGVSNQKRMTKLLYTDPITYGHNWMHFENSADKILCGKKEADNLYAMVDIAIMKYRNYCTYHGVDAGEELLEQIDKYLSNHINQKGELCAHNGRASFALLLKCTDEASCVKRVDEMVHEMGSSLGCVGHAFHAGVYFIAPLRNKDGEKILRRKDVDIDDLYNCANAARSSISEDDPTQVAVFDQKLLDEKLWIHHVEEKMQAALDNEEFVVYIQPKYNPVTEKLAGAEALVRWINDEDGFVPPGRFIPIFENNGFITKLDDYMISHIAKLQADWIKQGKKVVPVSVNVSRAHFSDENLAEHICELVDKYGCPHEFLEIELTESAFFDDKAALLKTVKKLQNKGFEVSMDDFGAGYSSLNSLKDLPLDVLKLDADFFRGEDGEERGEIVVAQAIALAKKLNMKIVAEGIEKKEQVDFLAKQNCDMIQGYYFAKPMPANEYEERMES